MIKEKICEACGGPIHCSNRRFCKDCNWIKKVCEYCSETFLVKRNHKHPARFCSHHCYSESMVTHGYRRKTFTCKECGNEFKKPTWCNPYPPTFCGRSCRTKNLVKQRGGGTITYRCENCGRKKTVVLSYYKTAKRHFCSVQCAHEAQACPGFKGHKGDYRTDIEQILEDFLIAHDTPYKFEFPIGRYAVDFAIPHIKLVIECDGEYWHSRPKDKVSDAKKDAYITSQGWTVIRLPGKTIQDGSYQDNLLPLL